MGDQTYSNSLIRKMFSERGIRVIAPQKSNELTARQRKGSKGGRPPAFDAHTYKGRNVVKRHFGIAKQWRATATRYDKLAITYRATAVLGAIVAWLRK